jgi:hypothetical protein
MQNQDIEALAREADCTHVDLDGDRAKALERLTAFAALIQRPEAALAEAVEWETLDGIRRTTDKAIAENWATRDGVRVIRRAVQKVQG